MLGNPRFRDLKANAPAETRFKTWWHLVGAAVEHAADCHTECCKRRPGSEPKPSDPKKVSFKDLFLGGERDDEQAASLVEVLKELRRSSPNRQEFKASEIVARCRGLDLNDSTFKIHLEQAAGKAMPFATVQSVSARLRSCVDRPVQVGPSLMALKFRRDHEGGWFQVVTTSLEPAP